VSKSLPLDIFLSREVPLIQPGDKDSSGDQRLRWCRAAAVGPESIKSLDIELVGTMQL
jgi:hypothetical protein